MEIFSKSRFRLLMEVYKKSPITWIDDKSAQQRINKLVYHRGLDNLTPFYVCKSFVDDARSASDKVIDFATFQSGEYFYIFPNGSYFKVIVKGNGALSDVSITMVALTPSGILTIDNLSSGNMEVKAYTIVNHYDDQDLQVIAHMYLSIHCFVEMAKNEQIILPPKKIKPQFHCKYSNRLPFKVSLLDANWYRESCQTHPFVVRGHWRLQACGKNWEDRKLVWVEKHLRNSYTKGRYRDA